MKRAPNEKAACPPTTLEKKAKLRVNETGKHTSLLQSVAVDPGQAQQLPIESRDSARMQIRKDLFNFLSLPSLGSKGKSKAGWPKVEGKKQNQCS